MAVFQDVALAPRPEEMLQILVRDVARSLDAAHCAVVFSVDEHRGRLIAVAERPEVRNLEIGLADCPEALHAAGTGRTAFIPDVRHHPLFAGWTGPAAGHPGQPTSAVAVPIVFQGKGLGFLILRTALPRPNLTADEVAFVETLVVTTARLLEHEDRRAIAAHSFGEGDSAPVGVTAGWVSCPGSGLLSPEDVLARAEADLVARKHPSPEVAA